MKETENLKRLIGQGKTTQVIQALLRITRKLPHNDLQEEVILQSARYEQYAKEKRLGVISAEEQNLSLTNINHALLSIINRLPAKAIRLDKKKSFYRSAGIGLMILFAFAVFYRNFGSQLFYQNNSSLQLTIRLEDENGLSVNEGELLVDIGHRRNSKSIGIDGEVDFEEIGAKFLHKSFKIGFSSKNYELAYPDSQYIFDGEPVYLAVKNKCRSCLVFGTIQNDSGELISNAIVMIKGFQLKDTTDSNGYFRITIPVDKMQEEYPVTVLIDDRIVWEKYISPDHYTPAEILITD